MEAVASASSIITVVQIAASVAKLCGGYILDVKVARWDIERVQQKTAILRDVVEKLAKIDDQTQAKPVSLSAHVIAAVYQCLQDLQELQGKLQPKSKHNAMRKVGWRALKGLCRKMMSARK
jgi:hypothetical protein